MTNRERFIDGQVFHVFVFLGHNYRYCAPNGEFSTGKVQQNASRICFDFKDFCDVAMITPTGIIFSISVFGKVHHDVLHFEHMVFEEGGTQQ